MNHFPAWLKHLLEIPDVTDILINGRFCQVDRGHGLEKVEAPLPEASQLEQELRELAFQLGGRLDIASPICDASFGNLRFHFLVPHGISDSAQLSIRIHRISQLSLGDLVGLGMLSAAQSDFLTQQLALRKTMVICGPTGSGKTTLLRALLATIDERVVVIEQVPELHLEPPTVSLRARSANSDGKGEITLADLVVATLRMRPDRIVVGEIRREEFAAFLQAVTNGHPGSLTTIHASSLSSVANRFVTLGLIAGLSPQLVNQLVLGGVDLVLQLSTREGSRRLEAIGAPGLDGGKLEILEVSR